MTDTPLPSDSNPAIDTSARSSAQSQRALFTPDSRDRSSAPILPWAIAGAVVLALLGGLLLATHGRHAPKPGTLLPPDPYASSLILSGLVMSESTSLSGGKSTYIDGHIRNAGSSTVTAATVQVPFLNDQALPPQVETLPLALIRTREPYVDTQPIGSAPLRPGDEREFRLIFEDIGANWNQSLPTITIVTVATH